MKYIITKNVLTIRYAKTQSFEIPEFITDLFIFDSNITILIIPKNIKILSCNCIGLSELILPDGIQFVYCSYNNLTQLDIPSSIIVLLADHNQLTNITVRDKLLYIEDLNISFNKFKDFDIYLPKTMQSFFIAGNRNIKVKYLDFIFPFDNYLIRCNGDYIYTLNNDRELEEFQYGKLYNIIQNDKHEYLDFMKVFKD